MTQALAFQQWCRRNGHQVVRVLAGRNPNRNWPDFFSQGFDVPVEPVASPGFCYRNGRRLDLIGTVWQACRRGRDFLASLRVLDAMYVADRVDGLVNFLEPLAGLHHWIRRPRVPQLAIGHQFMVQHPDYPKPRGLRLGAAGIQAFARLNAGRGTCYALSFFRAQDLPGSRLRVAPPLLRDEVTQMERSNEGFLLIYLLNAGYRSEVERWHARNPQIPIHCFYDRPASSGVERVDATLQFHPLHGEKFLKYMAASRGVVCSAGFESIAEAASLGKPALAIPVEGHSEQQLNANDAFHCGLAAAGSSFDLEKLPAAVDEAASIRYRDWLNESDARLSAAVNATFAAGRIPNRHRWAAATG